MDLYGVSRGHAARLARRESRALRDSGTAVITFRPGPAELTAMGNDFMARDRVDEIVVLHAGPGAVHNFISAVIERLRRTSRPAPRCDATEDLKSQICFCGCAFQCRWSVIHAFGIDPARLRSVLLAD